MIKRKRRITRDIFPDSRAEKYFFNGNTLLIALYPAQGEYVKFTVVASKKILKSAVERNTFKRTVYEAARKHQQELDHIIGGKIVFSLKKGVFSPTFQSIEEDIVQLIDEKKQ